MSLDKSTTELRDKESEDRPMSQTQRALTALRDLVINNRLAPGSSHLETELAEMIGVSRTPVREAALVLETQGLVEVRPRRGVRVLPLSPRDMEEIYQILTELEGLAAEQAAGRTLTSQEVAAVEDTLNDMDKALEIGDLERWAEADKRFHGLLVAMSENQRLMAAVDAYNDQVHRARILTLRLRPAPTRSSKDHRDLFEAIKSGDGKKARAIHTQHRAAAKALIIDLLNKHGFHQV